MHQGPCLVVGQGARQAAAAQSSPGSPQQLEQQHGLHDSQQVVLAMHTRDTRD